MPLGNFLLQTSLSICISAFFKVEQIGFFSCCFYKKHGFQIVVYFSCLCFYNTVLRINTVKQYFVQSMPAISKTQAIYYKPKLLPVSSR